MTDLSHLRGLIERATKGPWDIGEGFDENDPDRVGLYSHTWGCFAEVFVQVNDEPSAEGEANAALIVEMRNSLPALLDEIERLRGALDSLLATSGARGTYHALKYADAVEKAETALSQAAGMAYDRLEQAMDLARRAWRENAREQVADAASVPADVARLVIAARNVAFNDPTPESLKELDQASEAFASRVPWEDDPRDIRQPPEGLRPEGAQGEARQSGDARSAAIAQTAPALTPTRNPIMDNALVERVAREMRWARLKRCGISEPTATQIAFKDAMTADELADVTAALNASGIDGLVEALEQIRDLDNLDGIHELKVAQTIARTTLSSASWRAVPALLNLVPARPCEDHDADRGRRAQSMEHPRPSIERAFSIANHLKALGGRSDDD